MAKVFVTGISGFIGKEISKQLHTLGHDVYGTSLNSKGNNSIRCDLRDSEAVKAVLLDCNPDVVIHTAALSSVTLGSTMDYYDHNVLATENVALALIALGGHKRLVFTSTAGVYGNQGVEILSEDLCPRPVSHYGMSKFVCERLLANYFNQLDITIIRPFNIIGPNQNLSFILPKLVMHFQKKLTSIRLGNLDPVRDYIDVETTAKVIIDLTFNTNSYGETVNLCSGVGISVREMLKSLQQITGHEIEVVAAPEFTRKDEVWRLLGSTAKLNTLLGYTIECRDLSDVLNEMLQFNKTS